VRPAIPAVPALCVSLWLGLFCWAGASFAQAEPYAPPTEPAPAPNEEPAECPEAPAAYEGTDDAASQVEQLRQGLRDQCIAERATMEAIETRTGWIAAELVRVVGHQEEHRTQLYNVVEDLNQIHLDIYGEEGKLPVTIAGYTRDKPLPVEGETGDSSGLEYSGKLVSSIDAAGEGSMAALYILIGLIVAMPIAVGAWKLVDRAL
jgi:hypothetical protein